MKKLLAMILALCLAMSMVACGSSEPAPSEEGKKELPTTTPAPEETSAPLYKDIMKPYNEIQHGNRLIVLQNLVRYTLDGIYTKDTAPVPEMIPYNGAEAMAFAVTDVTQHLINEVTGTVKVFDVAGTQHDLTAEEFLGMFFVIDDFQSGNSPVLRNGDKYINDFDYAVFESGEGIFSVITEQEVNINDVLAKYTWDNTDTYNLVATDYFYIPITPDDYDEGGLRGTLSGSVNAAFVDMVIAMGKLNDVAFIEKIVE